MDDVIRLNEEKDKAIEERSTSGSPVVRSKFEEEEPMVADEHVSFDMSGNNFANKWQALNSLPQCEGGEAEETEKIEAPVFKLFKLLDETY